MPKNHTLIVTGGGSGGHVLPGVAIAQAWLKAYPDSGQVLYVGARGGLEEKLVPRYKIPLALLTIGSFNQVSRIRQLKTLIGLPWAFVRSLGILLSSRPSAVVGVGGYASGPVVLVAATLGKLMGIKTGIVEANAVLGLTNRVLSKFVDRIFVSFPKTQKSPPRKSELTGYPIRTEIHPLAPAEVSPFTILIFGGSQGAVGLNSLVIQALPELRSEFKAIRFIHQTGERDFLRVKKAHEELASPALVVPFIDQMTDAYQAASLLICRAGASTLAEIASVGRAAILVPLPTAADNHQEINARTWLDQGAAELVLQNQSDGKELANIIKSYMKSPAKLKSIAESARSLKKPEAAEKIVELLSH